MFLQGLLCGLYLLPKSNLFHVGEPCFGAALAPKRLGGMHLQND